MSEINKLLQVQLVEYCTVHKETWTAEQRYYGKWYLSLERGIYNDDAWRGLNNETQIFDYVFTGRNCAVAYNCVMM
jgi:hypothetical protein